ncbi:uncharacterized protein LOC129584505 [Paramacrobiotus metropolitanus]|uniref:uncharacterized protein LOC129584505 n=1 Tax=Paramacrobiotus metropolitanus TaxID=2943436 RepID=UPI002445A709|nr:uncharacterized protein LOC129584505 [Paramacrobiotus metropolitanus]
MKTTKKAKAQTDMGARVEEAAEASSVTTASHARSEVNEDLRSLFQDAGSKPFKFFDNNDQDMDDPLSTPSAALHKFPQKFTHFETVDETPVTEDEFIPTPHVFSVSHSFTGNFFFTVDDPRLLEGRRYLAMSDEERASNLAEWEKTRPQMMADFKKQKKQANRKRTFMERKQT